MSFNRSSATPDLFLANYFYGFFVLIKNKDSHFLNANVAISSLESCDDNTSTEIQLYVPDKALLFVVQLSKDENAQIPYAAFIIPAASQSMWHFRTRNGREAICKQASTRRMVFVKPIANEYTVEQVKSTFEHQLRDLKPSWLTDGAGNSDDLYKIPIMSLPEAKKREFVDVYQSESGVVVRDYKINDQCWNRQLVFLNGPRGVQSEIDLTVDGIFVFNDNAAGYGQVTVWLVKNMIQPYSNIRVLLIGLGGGEICHGLCSESCHLTALELNREVIDVGYSYFGLKAFSNSLHVINQDGISYLEKNDSVFDVIIVDVCQIPTESGLVTPTDQFTTNDSIEILRKRTSNLLIINYVSLSNDQNSGRNEFCSRIQKYFKHVWILPTGISPESLGDNDLLVAWVSDPPEIRTDSQTPEFVKDILNAKG